MAGGERRDGIRHGDFTSRDDLIDKTVEKNAVAKPYRWTCDGLPTDSMRVEVG